MVTTSMVLLLAVSPNFFGAVFTKLGTSSVVTSTLLGLPLSDIAKLGTQSVREQRRGPSRVRAE
jgi:hypothetical protein